MSTLFLKFLLNYPVWLKIQLIRCQKFVFDTVPLPFHGQTVALPMQMPVKPASYIIAVKDFQYFVAGVPLISGRVVQKYDFRQIAGGFQRCFQPHQFSAEHLFVMPVTSLFLEKPSSCAANGIPIIFIVVVI